MALCGEITAKAYYCQMEIGGQLRMDVILATGPIRIFLSAKTIWMIIRIIVLETSRHYIVLPNKEINATMYIQGKAFMFRF